MQDLKMTSQKLADKTGISKRTIDEYRSSRRKEPSLSNGLKIADALGIDVSQVNVKATTEEGLGFTGSGEGISAQAICLLNSPIEFCTMEVGNESAAKGGCEGCGGCKKA